MWGNFDLNKLGEQLSAVAGEALQKATADVEKSIDNTLGIKQAPVTAAEGARGSSQAAKERKAPPAKAPSAAKVVTGLTSRNEQLAMQASKLSEADFEAARTEFETARSEFESRLAAAERKVYALTKERDALRKGSEKLSEYGALIKEKDDIIKQVMDEGEKLSKKQNEMEGVLRKLRNQVASVEADKEKLAAKLAAEEAGAADLRKAKAKLERDMAVAAEQAKADLEAQREHFESLLSKARQEHAEAEERVRDAAAQGLARKLRDAEARCEALSESCVELRDALDRQRQAADLREEMLKADLADLERRCQAAELRHQDLASKVPEATRPLLRQIEAMQAAVEAQADAWAGAEASLQARIGDAEARAASAAERERLAVDKMQILSAKVCGLEASLAAARQEVRSLQQELEEARRVAGEAREVAAAASHQAELQTERCRVQALQLDQLEAALAEAREAERAAVAAAEADTAALRRDCGRRLAEAEAELEQLRARVAADAMSRAPEPPAMAAPGYQWVLVKEGERPGHADAGLVAHTDTHHKLARDGSTSDLLNALRAPSSSGGLHTAISASHHNLSGGYSGGSGAGGAAQADSVQTAMASELESLRGALRARTGELAAAQQQVAELEATRDRLAEELVAGSSKAEAAQEVLLQHERLEAELVEARARLASALELVGERDERVEELLADLQDVKSMYKDQIEFMVQQLADLQSGATQHASAAGHGHGHGLPPSSLAPPRDLPGDPDQLPASSNLDGSMVARKEAAVASITRKGDMASFPVEDAHVVSLDIDGRGTALFAVFDGHSGREVSAFCAQHIEEEVVRSAAFSAGDLPGALREAFLSLDGRMRDEDNRAELAEYAHSDDTAGDKLKRSSSAVRKYGKLDDKGRYAGPNAGSTAAVALLRGHTLVVAHAGDSRVILSENGEAQRLTEDHNRHARREGEDLPGRATGQFVFQRPGGLPRFKDPGLPADQQAVTAAPDTTSVRLGGGAAATGQDPHSVGQEPAGGGDYHPRLLVVACDGLWDVLNPQMVINFLELQLGQNGGCLRSAVAALMHEALAHDSASAPTTDNVTAVVVKLPTLPL
ncbi:hypothetical protein GPECTOR_1g911 [Gonium pectorale]|uniref:PPM-type phosphatase domain-containing protein n=1 Tax=Gonium pectorale TaxID=33097 RepID=A0A150H4F3_GONPE|nr:hypothetical protein GPECTOR_1g911 [Gonium pectorale]|eukprot:KXZ57009.1 hypothetical protein GPECTOR_1g911 [Gonium pectorale]